MSKLILIAFLIWALILLCGNYADVNTITLSPDDEEMPDWGRFKADFRHDRLVYLEPGNYFAHEGYEYESISYITKRRITQDI